MSVSRRAVGVIDAGGRSSRRAPAAAQAASTPRLPTLLVCWACGVCVLVCGGGVVGSSSANPSMRHPHTRARSATTARLPHHNKHIVSYPKFVPSVWMCLVPLFLVCPAAARIDP